jgi:hypothetical protein
MATGPGSRADLVASVLWLALGAAALQQSWTMDRLEAQGTDPWSVPGLVPGLIGGILILLGAAMLLRSLKGRTTADAEPEEGEAEDAADAGAGRKRLGITLLLCLLLVFGLIGRGLPFWLAAAVFVAAFVLLFTWRERQREGRLARGAVTAAAYGLAVGAAIHLLFQEVFLVRLP